MLIVNYYIIITAFRKEKKKNPKFIEIHPEISFGLFLEDIRNRENHCKMAF